MKPVLTPGQMRALEQAAFERGVSPLLLMEDAARCMFDRMRELLPAAAGSGVFLCGSGNNGGDGLALARLFLMAGYATTVFMPKAPSTDQAGENLRYYTARGGRVETGMPDRLSCDFCVDALLGTGFHGMPAEPLDKWIRLLGRSALPFVFSVDLPSGMNGETGECALFPDGTPACVRATHTLTLGFHKTGLLTGPARGLAGEVIRCPIQLPDLPLETDCYLTEEEDLSFLPGRPADLHKGGAGRVLLFAGSRGMAGAAAMAAQAALRMGAGLVTIACEDEVLPVLQTLVPNAMCVPIDEAAVRPPAHDVLAAGCGLGTKAETRERLLRLLERTDAPVILDADALNLLAKERFPLPKNTLLTPHAGEAARLLGVDVRAVTDRLRESAVRLAGEYRASVLLKSSVSVATDGERCYINALTAPALAKGGSGDALCGIAAAVTAQRRAAGKEPDPAKTGAVSSLILSLCGRKAEELYTARCPLTGDVIDQLPGVLAGLPC